MRHLREIADWPDFSGTRYEVLEKIGAGGMGTVYLATDHELERPVALKVIGAAALGPEGAERMRQEAKILARLEHPGLVPVHDVGHLPDGRIYYAMKLVRGQRLDQIDWTPETSAEVLRVVERICEAVAFAHAHGVIHRDLKPENVMVGAFGEVLVLDWGVAKVLGEEEAPAPSASGDRAEGEGTLPGTILGTPGFMAPEQARGQVDRVDARSDVYAIGAILHDLLTRAHRSGNRPPGLAWTAPEDPRQLNPEVPRRLAAICQRALAEDPCERYESAEALAADIGRFSRGDAVRAHQDSWLERAGRFVQRYRLPISIVLAYLVMRVALFLFFEPE
ncbi:MAG: serine/threonine-protein kinase [Planctomycetota bacterium]